MTNSEAISCLENIKKEKEKYAFTTALDMAIESLKRDEIGLTDTVKQIHDGVYKQGFDDGIDKLVEMINEMPTYENESGEYMPMPIEIMAKQLKEKE